MKISFSDLWTQCGGTNRKCAAENPYLVTNRAKCQQNAQRNGHKFYQYVEQQKRCQTCATLGRITKNTGWDWRIYGESCGSIFHNF